MRRQLLIFAAATAILAGCADQSDNAAANDAGPPAGTANAAGAGDGNQAVPQDAILLALERANPIPATPDDAMTISNVAFVTGVGGHFITADVNHSDCPPYEYKAYWNGSWEKSDPPGMTIVLRFGAAEEGCRPDINQKVQINITDQAEAERRFWVRVEGGTGEPQQIDVALD